MGLQRVGRDWASFTFTASYRLACKILTHIHTHLFMQSIPWRVCHKAPFYTDVIINSLITVMHFSPPEISVTSYSCYSILPFSNKNNVTLLLGNLGNFVCSPLLSSFFPLPSCGQNIIAFLLKLFSHSWLPLSSDNCHPVILTIEFSDEKPQFAHPSTE